MQSLRIEEQRAVTWAYARWYPSLLGAMTNVGFYTVLAYQINIKENMPR